MLSHGDFRPVCYCTITQPIQTDASSDTEELNSSIGPLSNVKWCGVRHHPGKNYLLSIYDVPSIVHVDDT